MDQIHGNPDSALLGTSTDVMLALARDGYKMSINTLPETPDRPVRVCVLTIAAGVSEVHIYLTLDQMDAIEKLIGAFAQDLLTSSERQT